MAKGDGGGHNKFAMRKTSEQEVRRLYFEELLSQAQIAEQLGVTQGAVAYWFKRWGIQGRSHDDSLILLGKSGRFTGEKNPRWSGGRHKNAQGYVLVRMPNHPRARRGYVREHILVWEQANGISLPEGWHIHHKNGMKDDNRPENLAAMTNAKHRDVLPELLRRVAELEARVRELTDELADCKKGGSP